MIFDVFYMCYMILMFNNGFPMLYTCFTIVLQIIHVCVANVVPMCCQGLTNVLPMRCLCFATGLACGGVVGWVRWVGYIGWAGWVGELVAWVVGGGTAMTTSSKESHSDRTALLTVLGGLVKE